MYKDTNINMVSLVSMVLNRVLLNCDIEYLKTEWKAFYNEPLQYAYLVDLINKAIDENCRIEDNEI